MARIAAALLIVMSFLMLAPIIESGTSESTQFFQAVGNADGGPVYPARSLGRVIVGRLDGGARASPSGRPSHSASSPSPASRRSSPSPPAGRTVVRSVASRKASTQPASDTAAGVAGSTHF